MAIHPTTDPTRICEDTLRAAKAYNIEHGILPSENRIIDRLLARHLELTEAYAEIHDKLHDQPDGIEALLGIVISAAAFWSPDRVANARDARIRLQEVNREIDALAANLASLLDERSEIHNTSGFVSDTHYHIVDLIAVASSENGYYRSYLKDDLELLRGRFDLKYWPSLAEIVRVIGRDAGSAGTEATDPLTRAATTGPRGSRVDFFKALFEAIKENDLTCGDRIPHGFKLSDSTLASLANCVLDLGPDNLVDAAYVKRLRQRQREVQKSKR